MQQRNQQTIPAWLRILPWLSNLQKSIGKKRPVSQSDNRTPLGFPQTDIPYRTNQLATGGMVRNEAEVTALQEAEMARRQELSRFPASLPKRAGAGAWYLKQNKGGK
jgi:hypothetical protein